MKDQTSNKPSPDPEYANLDQSELSSNQDAKALPWVAGERKVAVSWISPIYNLYTTNAGPRGKK